MNKCYLSVLATVLLVACSSDDDDSDTDGNPLLNTVPGFISGDIVRTEYDGISDDLLTAGIGVSGLQLAAPGYADPAAPSLVELRRNAIYTNYRALIDYTDAGGFGRLYGPISNADSDTDANGDNDGKVAGSESIAVVDDGSGRQNVVLMVQVPDSFDVDTPCIVTGTSSGSRGVYGAIGTAGEWGLTRGCAVAYTDKGTGNGLHDQQSDAVLDLAGQLSTAAQAGSDAHFRTDLSEEQRLMFATASPERVAYKHAHSQQNPEQDWGTNTLQAVEFAFYVLNEQFGETTDNNAQRLTTLTPANTTVIASSVSNGAGAALAAAEQDVNGLIDGVAVTEPNVQPLTSDALAIRQGDTAITTIGRPLVDYFSYANVYQACAILSERAGLSLAELLWPPVFTTAAENRCTALQLLGLLDSTTLSEQADEALDRLHAYGWQPEQDFLQQSHFRFATNAIVVTYVNAYGRFAVNDSICGFSFANTDATGAIVAQDPTVQASLFASGNGIPPTSGINVVYDNGSTGTMLDFLATSPRSGLVDFALDGALCLRELVTGVPLGGERLQQSERVQTGISEVQLDAELSDTPTIIVAGRSDTLIPVNHAARAYYGSHKLAAGDNTPVRYYEVTNAQHFDTFIALGALLGYDTRFVPLHVYFTRAMDLMWDHLQNGRSLPASQVVRTTPRSEGAMLADDNIPDIADDPLAADAITFSAGTLQVPE